MKKVKKKINYVDNKKLYEEDLQVDLTISNNCIKSKKIKASPLSPKWL